MSKKSIAGSIAITVIIMSLTGYFVLPSIVPNWQGNTQGIDEQIQDLIDELNSLKDGASQMESNVFITSIEDGEIFHSIVIVDASIVNAEKLEVLIDGIVVSDYIPYYWNNLHEPVGTYNVTVRCKIYEGNWTQDTKMIEIPEEFIVPINYEFIEDFVVHEGQTVVFENWNWSISSNFYGNGWNSYEEKGWFSINVYGDIILDNTTIECAWFIAENYANVTLINNSTIIGKETLQMTSPSGYTSSARGSRFDDYANLNYDNSITIDNIGELNGNGYTDYRVYFSNGMAIRFWENSTWTAI